MVLSSPGSRKTWRKFWKGWSFCKCPRRLEFAFFPCPLRIYFSIVLGLPPSFPFQSPHCGEMLRYGGLSLQCFQPLAVICLLQREHRFSMTCDPPLCPLARLTEQMQGSPRRQTFSQLALLQRCCGFEAAAPDSGMFWEAWLPLDFSVPLRVLFSTPWLWLTDVASTSVFAKSTSEPEGLQRTQDCLQPGKP